MEQFVPYIGLAVGVVARVILPWLIKRLESPSPWDWNKAAGQLVAGVLAFITLLAANPTIGEMTWQGALAIGVAAAAGGWGAADIGRTVKKVREKE